MSDTPNGGGWWQASDGRWYPPESEPGAAGSGGSGPPRRGLGVLLVVVVLVALGVAASAVTFVVARDDDPGASEASTTSAEPDVEAILLEPAADGGTDPFVDATAITEVPTLSEAAVSAAADAQGEMAADEESGALVTEGSTPGLYGGTRDEQVCDATALIEFLDTNRDRAEAWASVLRVEPSGIRDYVVNLTPVLLTADTWVTNHGFADGAATPFQAVLQAGTAVMIDDTGVPRVRCACGNPLDVPIPAEASLDVTDGDGWDYDAGAVSQVRPGEELSVVELIDVGTGETFERGLGAGKTGDIQATLRWTNGSDLDLHVIDPSGFEIDYQSTVSPSGGELDIDVIPDCGDATDHTENVFWSEGGAPLGEYQVFVDHFADCGEPATFELQVLVNGRVQVSESGEVAPGADTATFTFNV